MPKEIIRKSQVRYFQPGVTGQLVEYTPAKKVFMSSKSKVVLDKDFDPLDLKGLKAILFKKQE